MFANLRKESDMSGDLTAFVCALLYTGFVFGWSANVIVNGYRKRNIISPYVGGVASDATWRGEHRAPVRPFGDAHDPEKRLTGTPPPVFIQATET